MNNQEYQYKLDHLRAPEPDEIAKHPTPEQLLVREAIRALTEKQKQAWEYHIFEKLTLDAIGRKMGISHQAVSGHIKAAEKRIRAFCKTNKGVYQLLKDQSE